MARSVAEKHQSAQCRLKNISEECRLSIDQAVLSQCRKDLVDRGSRFRIDRCPA
jgi:hypothetical protein